VDRVLTGTRADLSSSPLQIFIPATVALWLFSELPVGKHITVSLYSMMGVCAWLVRKVG
jgi:hypothetical protein